MKIPTTLKHKPVITVENYENVDGRTAYQSDAKGLSLGLAQWNDRGRVDISAKVWRYTGEKWSRQSEELPLHRVLDLAILNLPRARLFRGCVPLCQAVRRERPADRPHRRAGRRDDQVAVCPDNPMIDEDIQLFSDALARDDEMLAERLRLLSNLLQDMGYGRRKRD